MSWHSQLRSLYDLALQKYAAGNREPGSYFDPKQTAFLASIGIRPMEVYDFAEDKTKYGEPDWETFLLVQAARRDYFLHIQEGKWSGTRISVDKLPAKTEAMDGIVWLPRIIPKAWAKLKGEMPDELMYGCGGDRAFFKDNHIEAADFLRVVWSAGTDNGKIAAYVKAQKQN
jgi:hypothetical protein